MKDFKFFQKGTTNVLDGDETFITTSFNDDTPEGVMGRRRLYHTNINQYGMLTEGLISEITRRINGGESNLIISQQIERERGNLLQMTENERTFFPPIKVTKVNTKWWMKIKMYIQDNSDMFSVIFLVASVTICFGLMIGKVLNVW